MTLVASISVKILIGCVSVVSAYILAYIFYGDYQLYRERKKLIEKIRGRTVKRIECVSIIDPRKLRMDNKFSVPPIEAVGGQIIFGEAGFNATP